MPNVREGKFRPLAVGSAERITYVPELRDVPGMKELLPDANIDMQSWYGINAPAGTPENRIAILHRAITQVVRSDDFRRRMEPIGFSPIADESPAAYGTYMGEQEKVWQRLVEISGATLD
jgi:tripartite-type tricarboxylate transporter receptor subunit TctC